MEIKKYGNLPEFMSLSEFHAYYSCSTVFVWPSDSIIKKSPIRKVSILCKNWFHFLRKNCNLKQQRKLFSFSLLNDALNLRNIKRAPCLHRLMQTREGIWENSKICVNPSRR